MNKGKVEEFRLLAQDVVQNCKNFMDYPEFGGNKLVESVVPNYRSTQCHISEDGTLSSTSLGKSQISQV
jgi:hypothetical protein